MLKYHTHPVFLTSFEDEQDYVDAMFIYIILYNFGTFLKQEDLL